MEGTEQISKFTKNNQSTEKVLTIIEFLSNSKEPLRLIDIATALNYNSSTALRFLNSLEQSGYVYKDRDTLKYQMTFKMCGLASQISSHTNLVEIAAGPIKDLSMALGECVCLAIEQNYSVIYVYVADGPGQMLRTTQRIGTQAPMHCTGVGKVMLSEFSDEELNKLIDDKGLIRYTDNTFTTKDQLLTELAAIRKRGFGYDNEECEMGARCIAFPIRNYTGKIVAAMSVTGPAGRMTDQFIDLNFRKISETVRTISYQLGYLNAID